MTASTQNADKLLPGKRATQLLRKLSLAAADGDFLGSETDLLESLEVSRPTFRQAARLLVHEQLVEIRMGAQGGYYARRPNSESVVRSAATFLHLRDATLRDAIRASYELRSFSVKLACANDDAALADDLDAFVSEIESTPDVPEDSVREASDYAERRFRELINAMAGNPIMSLMYDVVARFLATDRTASALRGAPPIMRARRLSIARLGRAILARDPDTGIKIISEQYIAYSALIPPTSMTRPLELDRLSGGSAPR